MNDLLNMSCCCGVRLGDSPCLGGGVLCDGILGVLTPLAVIGRCLSLGTRQKKNVIK